MGQPKPLLALAGETMIERQVRLLRSICRSVAVIGLSDGLPPVDVPSIPDVIRGRGPLGGIFSGLLRTRTEFNLFLGCDLPFVPARFLEILVRRAQQCGAGATIAEMPTGGVQPLCAVYRRAALPMVRANLDAGRNKAQSLACRLRRAVIPWSEIARAGLSPRIFANINTPEDYETAKRILNGGHVAEGRDLAP
jgi:molybdopterin-guanine dinucleotide biosynthesis protein A